MEDLYPALKVIAGPDWHDSGVVDMPLLAPGDVSMAGLRVAYFEEDGVSRPTKETRETVEATPRLLAEACAAVERAMPDLTDVWPITRAFWHLDDASGEEVGELYRRWDGFRGRMLGFMRGYDAILCPVDRHPAPLNGVDDPERFSYTLAYSLTGWPCAVVRAGISPGNLPIGIFRSLRARGGKTSPWQSRCAWKDQEMAGVHPLRLVWPPDCADDLLSFTP